MNVEYIKRALCFHGQPMQKIWDDERGAGDLQKLGIGAQPNYDIYQERQKYFTFQDRAKRFKLHQFFARKAEDLFDGELIKYANAIDEKNVNKLRPHFSTLPPYELYSPTSLEKNSQCWNDIIECIKPGDIIYGILQKRMHGNVAWCIKPICTAEPIVRYLKHLPIKVYVKPEDAGTSLTNKNISDFIRCEVLKTAVHSDTISVGLIGIFPQNANTKLGVIDKSELPLYFRVVEDDPSSSYEEFLTKSKEFLNPNYDVLFTINGLNVNDTYSLMKSLKEPFPPKDYAKELRSLQANKWAFRSVAEGIERFKNGQHMEAFQCLNRALSIDPHNVEGLVARGALYANRGSFQKAVDDFGTALKLNEYHANARKYMGETLVALGRSLEEDKEFEKAAKAYTDCLEIIPQHIQARECLGNLNLRLSGIPGNVIPPTTNQMFNQFPIMPAPNSSNLFPIEINKVSEKKAQKSSSSSEDSSSGSGSESSSSETEAPNSKQREPSLSPLSKRMALHAAAIQRSATAQLVNKPVYDQPFYYNTMQPTTTTTTNIYNEFKLDEDDTETRVQKLLQEASKHKKEKKIKKKSKSKKTKKSKEKKQKDFNPSADLENSSFQNNYLQNVGSQDIRSKLNEDIHNYERKIAEIKSRQALLRESLAAPSSSGNAREIITIEDSPPPEPPSMKPFGFSSRDILQQTTSSSSYKPYGSSKKSSKPETEKLSFQIRKPVKVDKFGLIRLATPPKRRSRTRSRSLSPHGNNPSSRRRRDSRSRSRSPNSRYRSRRSRYSRSHSRSRSGSRSRRSSRSRHRDRTRSKSQRSSRYRSRSRGSSSYRRDNNGYKSPSRSTANLSSEVVSPRSTFPSQIKSNGKFKNRTWVRPEFKPLEISTTASKKENTVKEDDGPTIEEIDEIINRAQKERKQEIIKRDKDLLKKPYKGTY